MQRRAAAVTVAFFLVISAGAFAFIGAAEKPAITIQDPDYSLQTNATRTIGGTTYTFIEVGEGSATATWTNESARWTATLEHNSTVQYHGGNYTVRVAAGDSPTRFRLVEKQVIDKPTVTQNGTTYVVVEENGETTFVPRDEYLPEPKTHFFAEGDPFDYQGNTTTVADVTSSGVTLEWFAPRTNEVSFNEGETTTLGDTEFIAHFHQVANGDDPTYVLELTDNLDDYQDDVAAQHYFTERVNGLWGVTILSSLSAALVVMLSFLPSRY